MEKNKYKTSKVDKEVINQLIVHGFVVTEHEYDTDGACTTISWGV